jgi:heme/copper-type cytochrome/quinol oxidase subunit 2
MLHMTSKPAATLVALAFVAGVSDAPRPAAAPPDRAPAAHASEVPAARVAEPNLRSYHVTASEGGIIPGHIRVRKGEKVRITFTSKDDKYSIKFKDFGVKQTLTPEAPVTIEIAPSRPGSYEFKCTRVWGVKRFAGSNGTLVVTD